MRNGHTHRQRITDHDDLERRRVLWRLVITEGMRSSNVTRAIREEQESRDGHLLSHTAVVALHESHVQRHGGRTGGHEEVGEELDGVGHVVALVHDGGADDGWDDDGDDEDAVHLTVAACEPACAGDDACGEKRVGDVDEGRLQAGEAKGLDDDVGEVLGGAVGDLSEELDGDDEPCLGIDEAFLELVEAPVGVLGATGSSNDGSLSGNASLLLVEELGLGDAVREPDEHGNSPEEGADTKNDVHPAPWADVVVDVTDNESHETGEEPADRVASEPDADTSGHLVSRVPGRSEIHKRRRDSRLSDTE